MPNPTSSRLTTSNKADAYTRKCLPNGPISRLSEDIFLHEHIFPARRGSRPSFSTEGYADSHMFYSFPHKQRNGLHIRSVCLISLLAGIPSPPEKYFQILIHISRPLWTIACTSANTEYTHRSHEMNQKPFEQNYRERIATSVDNMILLPFPSEL